MVLQLDLDRERYVSLLEKLIGEVEFLQDNQPKFVPQEDIGSYTVLLQALVSHYQTNLQALLVLAVSGSHTGYMQCNHLDIYGYIHVA